MKNKKKGRTLLPLDEKRTTTITVKVTQVQKSKITELATTCNMSVSSYMLARAYNYLPKARLTEEQHQTMKQFLAIRSHAINYSNALKKMPETERTAMFRQYSFMMKWLQALNDEAERLSVFLDQMGVANRVPAGA
jgi:hypothetical protein